MKPKKLTKMLQYFYTKEEMDKLADSLTEACEKVSTAEARKKAITSQATAELEAAKSEQNVILGKRRSGYEYRDVDCEETYDMDTRIATVVRMDSGVVIETRPMTAKELQVELDLNSFIPTGTGTVDTDTNADTDADEIEFTE